MTYETSFTVHHEIDVEADTILGAAEHVWREIMHREFPPAPDSACCFTVTERETGKVYSVDLAEGVARERPALPPESVNAELLTWLKNARECIAYCRRNHDDPQKGSGVPIEAFIGQAIARAEAQGQPEPIRLLVWDGVVEPPENLPPGVRMVIRETDTNGMDDKTGVDEHGHDYVDREYVGE